MTLSKRYHASTRRMFLPGRTHRDGAVGLSAIFVSDVIIPGRRPENQPDGLSPTTSRSEKTNEEGETGEREKERGGEAKVRGKEAGGKTASQVYGTKRDPRENSTRIGYSVQSYGVFMRNVRFSQAHV